MLCRAQSSHCQSSGPCRSAAQYYMASSSHTFSSLPFLLQSSTSWKLCWRCAASHLAPPLLMPSSNMRATCYLLQVASGFIPPEDPGPPLPADPEQGQAQWPAERPPGIWTREEAMLRTCSFGGLSEHDGPWHETELGGSDFRRPPRRYCADQGAARGQECTKHQRSTMCLLPGVMLYWCMTCRRCVFFHVMANAESPR